MRTVDSSELVTPRDTAPCARCGSPVPGEFRYCGWCGAHVGAAVAGEAADREARPAETTEEALRQLSVMFCDLVGSTALAEQLDPEALREVLRAFQGACAEVIERYDGHIAQYLGDGILVYFGYPRAHEDDAVRAVLAGLEIVTAIPLLSPEPCASRGIPLAVRVGIHTGVVVTGEVGGGRRREHLALGETPNIAARLQPMADSNTVVLSGSTHKLIERRIECEPLGLRELKGIAQPVELFRARREHEPQTTAEERAFVPDPAIGRETELGVLFDRFTMAAAGNGQVALIRGEPGIGKSRLVRSLAERLTETPHTWRVARCGAFYRNTSLRPVIRLLGRLARFASDDDPETRRRKLTELLVEHGVTDEGSHALIGALLELPVEGDPAVLQLSARARRERTLAAVVALLTALARSEPVVLVVEDLHWADPSTLELLERLIGEIGSTPMLLVLTARPEGELPWSEATFGRLTTVTIGRLSERDAAHVIERVSLGRKPPPAVVKRILAQAGGVPLFVEELTKTLWESGALQERDGRVELRAGEASSTVPATLHDSLMARLDLLGHAKDIAQLGAALGAHFRVDVLAAVLGAHRDSLSHELNKLVRADVIDPTPGDAHEAYAFRHALIQETAYNSLVSDRRRHLHERIARALEDRFPLIAEREPEVLGLHWTRARGADRACRYLTRAGDRSRSAYGNAEALAFYHDAVAQARDVLRSRDDQPDEWLAYYASLCERLGDVLTLVGRLAEARRACRQALAQVPESDVVPQARLLRKTSEAWHKEYREPEAFRALVTAEATLGDERPDAPREWRDEWVEIQLAKIWIHYFRGELEALAALVDRVRGAIQQHGSPLQRVNFHGGVIAVGLRSGRYAISESILAEVRALGSALEGVTDLLEIADARFNIAFTMLFGRQFERAEELIRSSIELARRIGDPRLQALPLAYLSLLHRMRGEVALAGSTARDAAARTEAAGMLVYKGLARATEAWAAWREGDAAAAESLAGEAAALWKAQSVAYPFQWTAQLILAAVHAERGRVAEAVAALRPVLDPAQQRLSDDVTGAIERAVDNEGPDPETMRERLDAVFAAARRDALL